MVFKRRRQLRAGLFDGVTHSTAVLLPVARPDGWRYVRRQELSQRVHRNLDLATAFALITVIARAWPILAGRLCRAAING
jgi:hypothetical protein